MVASGGPPDALDGVEVQVRGDQPPGAAGARGECGRAAQVEATGPHHGGTNPERPSEILDPAQREAGDLARARHPGAGRNRARPAGGHAAVGTSGGGGDLVEDPGSDGDCAHSVGERMVELDEHREGAARGAADHIHLPGRQTPFEGPLHQFTREPGGARHESAVLTPRLSLGQLHPLDVPVHIEVLVHEPGRTADRQQYVPDPHPQPGNRGGTDAQQLQHGLRADAVRRVGRRGEDGERAEVHGVGIGFEVPEGQIERCQ